MLERFRRALAGRLLKGMATRSFYGAGGGRLTATWRAPTSSADGELHVALTTLRNRSRELIRNGSYARRAKVVVVNNVIGAGIGMQAQVRPAFRARLDERINDAIEEAWENWSRAENCHTAGKLHFSDLERSIMGEVFEAGEVFVRKHYARFGRSAVPLALELVEADRLGDDHQIPPGINPAYYRMGIEHDAYMRPIAYWVRERHPGDIRPGLGTLGGALIRVPAREMIHLMVAERSPQSRGVPWLHTAMRRMNDMDGYTEAEIVAARAAAMYLGFITSDNENVDLAATANVGGQSQIDLEPGLMQRLNPGEDVEFQNPNRPNAALEPFLRYMLREVAAGTGVSYESLSRDYSQSNYSSSRLALLDDRDLWRVHQQWFVRAFREPLHREWLSAAVLARAIGAIAIDDYAARPDKFEAVKFKPRGWNYVDPTKEVEAYKEAVKAGFLTRADVIAQTANGLDIEDIDAAREQELAAAAARGLEFDTDPDFYMPPEPAPAAQIAAPPPAKTQDTPADAEDTASKGRQLARMERQLDLLSALRMAPSGGTPVSVAFEPNAIVVNNNPPSINVERQPIQFSPNIRVEQPPAVVNVTMPEQAAPVVNVTVPEQAAPVVNVTMPEQAAPIVNVEPANITVEATMPAPEVRIAHPKRARIKHHRDAAGELVESITEYEEE